MRRDLDTRLVAFAQPRALFFVPLQRRVQGHLLMALKADLDQQQGRTRRHSPPVSGLMSASSSDADWAALNGYARATMAPEALLGRDQ